MNNYLRMLNKPGGKPRMWEEVGDILITPDGIRWRIERTPTVGDLIHVGDTIQTSYNTGGIVISLHKYTICCCPPRAISSTIICEESWDPPKKTMRYHREVVEWSLIYVGKDAVPNKDGTYRESNHCYLNELVAVGDRILHLFEANEDEVFVTKKAPPPKPKFVQASLL